ncbi:hypothetical protein SynRCC2555_01656 [Synechococcus sp. WH 8101]|nr:hypothetical protein SynRCC2555_01656 [Synechococcus sp. WH 8101]
MRDPNEQLARLSAWGQSLAPALYRDQALYLQLLREQLPSAVRTVLTALLTADQGVRLDVLDATARQAFQAKIDALVQRCCSLLTVEQLMELSRQIEREHLVRRLQAQRALLDDRPTTDEAPGGGESSASIALSLTPPIDQPELLQGLLPPTQESPALQPAADAADDDDASAPESDDLTTLRSLFAMAGQVMASGAALSDAGSEAEQEDGTTDADPLDPDSDRLLPSLPLDLLHWMDGQDQALMRRLRNLSHALNVELMRAQLMHSLLPISLLDAALAGQLETLPSVSNLLRLRVPLPTAPAGHWVDLTGVLLRPADLEFDRIDLRRCRSRLRQRRRQLLTMVRQQRHWQRRATTRQVQQQWWPSPTNPPLDQS